MTQVKPSCGSDPEGEWREGGLLEGKRCVGGGKGAVAVMCAQAFGLGSFAKRGGSASAWLPLFQVTW